MADDRWTTVCFDCPPDLFDEFEAYLKASDTHENQSQAIRFALRQAIGERVFTVPEDLHGDVDALVNDSVVFEDREHVTRSALRAFLRDADEYERAK